jgi:hypothetical protein
MPGLLIVVGLVLLVMTFLLAFTIFGLIAAVVGVCCLAGGTFALARRGRRPPPAP